MTPSRTLWLAGAVLCSLHLACSSLARTPTTASTPWWQTETTSDSPVDESTGSSHSDSTHASVHLASADSAKPIAAVARPIPVDSLIVDRSPEAIAARRKAWARRSDDDRDRVRQVNEYAYWCVEQGLWDEARIHLEQALHVDSLAASLHNNLGIIYERMGRHSAARHRYRAATELNPERALYVSNLQRLQVSLEHHPRAPADSLGDDELLMPRPRGDRRSDPGAPPRRSEGNVDRAL